MNDSQLNINPLPPSNEEQVIIKHNRDKLPKLDIPKGEPLFIGRGELSSVHDAFFEILSNMAQAVGVNEEMRSLMEDAVKRAYIDEIEKRRRDNRLECEVEWLRRETLNSILSPRYRRSWRSLWLRKIPNEAQVLLNELTARQANAYYYNKAEALPPRNPQEQDEAEQEQEQEYTPYEVQLSVLQELLPRRMRKNKRAALDEVIEGLAASYANKAEEQKRYAAELEEAKAQLKVSEICIKELRELMEKLRSEIKPVEGEAKNAETAEQSVSESGEAPKDAPKGAGEELVTESESAPKENPEEIGETVQEAEEMSESGESGAEEHTETANGESEQGLYYGDLFDEGDE